MALSGTETVSTTERSLPGGAAYSSASPQTSTGTYQVWVDPLAMASGDEFRFRIYEKCLSGGTQRVVYEVTLVGAQTEMLVFPSLKLSVGWDVTGLKVAGTDRAFPFYIR